jgi:hypothetical protein
MHDDDSADSTNQEVVRFFEQTENELVHSGLFLNQGQVVEPVAADEQRQFKVGSIDPERMVVLLVDDDHTKTVHWPSEGGQYRPVDDSE